MLRAVLGAVVIGAGLVSAAPPSTTAHAASGPQVTARAPVAKGGPAYHGRVATVHPITPTAVLDTSAARPRRPLAAGHTLRVRVAGRPGIAAGADTVTLSVLVTSASGNGVVRIGDQPSRATAAVVAVRRQSTAAMFSTVLSGGTFTVTYAGTGAVGLRLVVTSYTARDLTGASLHTVAAQAIPATSSLAAFHLLPAHSTTTIAVAGAGHVPAVATAVLLSVTAFSQGTGAITVGPTSARSVAATTMGPARPGSAMTLVRLSGHGLLVVRNTSPRPAKVRLTGVGYYSPGTDGALFAGLHPKRVLDTAHSSIAWPRTNQARAAQVRDVAHLPASATAVVLALTAASRAGTAVAVGQLKANQHVAVRGTAGGSASGTAIVPLAPDGTVTLSGVTRAVHLLVGVVGYYAQPVRPRVVALHPGDNATGVDPTTSVVADLFLPDGAVDPRSLTAASATLTDLSTGTPVPARQLTSGGGDTLNISPNNPLKPFTRYRVTVTSGVRDLAGMSFAPFTSTFTTGKTVPPLAGVGFDKHATAATGKSFVSVTVGPDHRLYASTLDGFIYRWVIGGDGQLSQPRVITTVRDHAVSAGLYGAPTRTVIGLAFDPGSTASQPVLWITDDAAYTGTSNLPDFSDHLARLSGPDLGTYTDVLTGLPRSVKDHETNSVAFGPDSALYLTQGANSSKGGPDLAWGNRDEHQLTAAVLRLDVTRLPSRLPLDVRTTDAGGSYDPQQPGAPLTVYATGVRNAFDLVWHSNGHLYTPTNGSAAGGNAPGTPAVLPAGCARRVNGSPYTGPAVPALKDVLDPETDWVFDVHPGRYYGHPDPSRCEWVLGAGHTTTAADPFQVAAYPLGTQPDPNYDAGDVYEAGLHASADGVVEYRGNAFHGALDHQLLVVRYSNGQDVEAFTVDRSGRLSAPIRGITGLTGLHSPIDLTEDRLTGYLYVTELGSQDILLLRPTS